MLNQAELNFYGYNPNNIIKRATRGRINVILRYDAKNNSYVVTRRTKCTLWEDRYKKYNNADNRFYEFLYMTHEQLTNKIITGV